MIVAGGATRLWSFVRVVRKLFGPFDPSSELSYQLGAFHHGIAGSIRRLDIEQTMDSVLCGSSTCDPTFRAQVDVRISLPFPPPGRRSLRLKMTTFFLHLVTKIFPSVFRSGAKSNLTAPKAFSTPFRALSKRTSSYVTFSNIHPRWR